MRSGRNEELYKGIPETLNFDPSELGRDINEGPPEPSDSKEPSAEQKALEAQLKQLSDRVQQSQSVGAILADPNIQQYLAAKQAGKMVKLVEDQPQQEADPFQKLVPEDDDSQTQVDDIEDLTNQQLMQLTAQSTVKAVMSQLAPVLKEVREQFSQKVSEQEQVLNSLVQHLSLNQVEQAKQKYHDFDQYKDEMARLSRLRDENGRTLPIDELYRLAKASKSLDFTAESEKPSTPPRRSGQEKTSQRVTSRGRKGFADELSKALGEMNLDDQILSAYGARPDGRDIPI